MSSNPCQRRVFFHENHAETMDDFMFTMQKPTLTTLMKTMKAISSWHIQIHVKASFTLWTQFDFLPNTSVKHYSFHENTKEFLQTPYKISCFFSLNLCETLGISWEPSETKCSFHIKMSEKVSFIFLEIKLYKTCVLFIHIMWIQSSLVKYEASLQNPVKNSDFHERSRELIKQYVSYQNHVKTNSVFLKACKTPKFFGKFYSLFTKNMNKDVIYFLNTHWNNYNVHVIDIKHIGFSWKPSKSTNNCHQIHVKEESFFMKTMLKHWMISCLLCRNLSTFMKTMKAISSWHIQIHV